jgi:hypothetical protein
MGLGFGTCPALPSEIPCTLRAACRGYFLSRPAAAADAFLLKIVIEERLGYPVQLISDGLNEAIESVLNLTGPASVYAALARGDADMYPEVRVVVGACVRACVHACVRAWIAAGYTGQCQQYRL